MGKQYRRLKKNYRGRKKGALIRVDVARKAHHKRTLHAQMIDNKLKAHLARSLPEWMKNQNRRDIVGVDYPGKLPKRVAKVEKPKKEKVKKVKGPDPRRMVKAFYEPISNPVANCSSWYAYYYLSEFSRNLNPYYKKAVKTQFEKLSTQLDTAFLNYGAYAVLRELRHMKGMAQTVKTGKKLTKREKKLREKLINLPKGSFQKSSDDIIEFLGFLRKEGVDTTPKRKLFEIAEGLFHKLNWHSAYGGENWARIARTMKQRYTVNRTIWLDMMWALQHNTGTWLNKVSTSDKEHQILKRKTSRSPKSVLNSILDSKREGDMKKVGEIAGYFNPQVKSFISYLPSVERKARIPRAQAPKRRKTERKPITGKYILAAKFGKLFKSAQPFKGGYMNPKHTVALTSLSYAKKAFKLTRQSHVTGTQFKALIKTRKSGKKIVYYMPTLLSKVKYHKTLVDKAIKLLGGEKEVYVSHPKGKDYAPMNVWQIHGNNAVAIAPIITD